MEIPPPVRRIAEAVKAAGGRALLVGGHVRDALLARLRGTAPPEARDLDVEVYGVPGDALRALLQKIGKVDSVGEAFRVYKLGEVDVSLPRRDSKSGKGHRGFDIVGDPAMPVAEAARRRDFTVNAILADPLTGELVDPHGGEADLKAGRLRAVDATTFADDSLRVLRGLQFAARFEFGMDEATKSLCRSIPLDDLPAERLWGEMEKLLLRARRPSLGFALGLEIGVIDRLFPELKALVGCPQEPEWHPEGDVWVHTLQAIDLAAGMIADLAKPKQLAVMLGTLCHDVGKPPTTALKDGRIRSLDHEAQGLPPTTRFLDRLNVRSLDGYDLRGQVLALVGDHLKPGLFYGERERIGDGAFRRLSQRVDLDLLYRVAKADSLGRRAPGAKEPGSLAQEWFLERVKQLGVQHGPPKPILLGRHVLELGLKPGPRVGEICDAVYQLQLDGKIATLDDAVAEARKRV